jgi:hypothetical protein
LTVWSVSRIPCSAAVVALAAAVAWTLSPRMALGILLGGAWNLASLWCLAHLLGAWLGRPPSRRRALGWLLLKFPLLYALAFAAFRCPSVSVVGFGIGFTVVLVMAIGWFVVSLQRVAVVHPDGR